MMLYGRQAQEEVIGALVNRARSGRSGVLVMRGEAGAGKTALLDYAATLAPEFTVLRGSGVQTEAALPFAGLHQLLRPVLGWLDALPGRQADALRHAFLLAEPAGRNSGDRFLAGMAVLSLLTEAAPAVCLVDDAHWLDSASADALLFAARRLEAEGVVLIFAARDDSDPFPPPGLPECPLGPLDAAAARQLVDALAPCLDPDMRDRLLAEAEGNPLALTELAVGFVVTGRPTSPGTPIEPLPAGQRVQRMYSARISSLDEQAQQMLLIAAADPVGDLQIIIAAAERLGLGPGALAQAERADLVAVSASGLRFRHPLVRSAAYHGAPLASRQAAHGALAAALEGRGGGDVSRRAWHQAASISGQDERVATGLDQAARHAGERSDRAGMAAAYQRAAQLTPDQETRALRLLAAARAANDAGRGDWADQLAGQALELSGDALARAEAAFIRALPYARDQLARMQELLSAAWLIADEHPVRCVELLGEVIYTAYVRADGELVRRVLRRVDEFGSLPESLRPATVLIFQDARFSFGETPSARPDMRSYLAALRTDPAGASPRERMLAANFAWRMGDLGGLREISAAFADDSRSSGMVGWLPGALQGLVTAQIMAGEWSDARACAVEGLRLADDTGQPGRAAFLAIKMSYLDALAGDREGCRGWIDEAAEQRPYPPSSLRRDRSEIMGLLDLGYSQFDSALVNLEPLPATWPPGTRFEYQPDLVEAAVRAGRTALAQATLADFEEWAAHSGHPGPQAIAARCRALAGEQDAAGENFAQAVLLHERDGQPFEQARTRLLYGEWLRRGKRRSQAREQLHSALETFERLGAWSWAGRARGELLATGLATSRVRDPGPLTRLTPQEYQIVRLAAEGSSNREIAARLFLSHRTVGYHLYKAFPKLGISSREQLAGFLTEISPQAG